MRKSNALLSGATLFGLCCGNMASADSSLSGEAIRSASGASLKANANVAHESPSR